MDLPELIGGCYCGHAHFAAAAGVKTESLSVMIANEQLPRLPKPLEQRVAGRYAWALGDVYAYERAVRTWRAGAPVRNAERALERARRAEREQFELEQQTRLLTEQKRIADSTAAFDVAARAEQDRLDQEQRDIAFHQAELNANRRG